VYSRWSDRHLNQRGRAAGFAQGLNELDKIARFALAVAHSGQWTDENAREAEYRWDPRREQLFVAQRTVAVVEHPWGGLYLAANGVWNDAIEDVGSTMQRVIAALQAAGEGTIRIVPNPYGHSDRSFHAEMQLLRYFIDRGWRFEDDMIGVSKPCCERCADWLDRNWIEYSYWHDQPTGYVYVNP
jgi:hypothetical protein